MSIKNNFYVYVYIDPRNHQEFYYGKGQGSRKLAHLEEESETLKSKQIRSIKAEGLQPIIRVVASNLSEDQAFLIEKTLIWKLGTTLTNISTGSFSKNFRPPNSLHKEIFGFDYENGIFYVNVGENENRNWDDCVKYGFMSAGQDWKKYGRKLYALRLATSSVRIWQSMAMSELVVFLLRHVIQQIFDLRISLYQVIH